MVLLFDVGGTSTRLAVSHDGETLEEIVKLETDASAAGLAKLLGGIQELVRGRKLDAAVGGLPGQLDPDTGEFLHARNLPEWEGLPVYERIEELVGCPLRVVHDTVLGGLGEAHFGAGSSDNVTAYYTISTGVGAVRVVNGAVDASIKDFEIGYQMNLSGEETDLENLIGGASVEARTGQKPETIKDKKVWAAAENVLARAVYNTNLFWTPDIIVFGGSMMRDIDLERVSEILANLPIVITSHPRLVHSKLGDAVGLYGALAWLKLNPQ